MKSISEFMKRLIAHYGKSIRGIILAIVEAEINISAQETESRKSP